MTNNEMVEAAVAMHEGRSGYHYDRKRIEAAVEGGLQEGDDVPIGNNAHVKIQGGTVVVRQWDRAQQQYREITRVLLEDLSDVQREKTLICKAYQAGRLGSEVGP